jgi:hypothetical protein
MLVIQDFGLIVLIANRKKTVHHWPAGTDDKGHLRHPKMSPNTVHNIYEHAPHGRYGSKYEPPMIIVKVKSIGHDTPYEWEEEDMLLEGFESLEAYGQWWDHWRVGDRLCKPWREMQDEPFWFCVFEFCGFNQAFHPRLKAYAKKLGRA